MINNEPEEFSVAECDWDNHCVEGLAHEILHAKECRMSIAEAVDNLFKKIDCNSHIECKCTCHYSSMLHCVPCCWNCPKCGKEDVVW